MLLQVIIFAFAVEGTWEAWAAWSNCFQNNGTKIRDRVFTGGQPCNGEPEDTQNCPGKLGDSGIIFFPYSTLWWSMHVVNKVLFKF